MNPTKGIESFSFNLCPLWEKLNWNQQRELKDKVYSSPAGSSWKMNPTKGIERQWHLWFPHIEQFGTYEPNKGNWKPLEAPDLESMGRRNPTKGIERKCSHTNIFHPQKCEPNKGNWKRISHHFPLLQCSWLNPTKGIEREVWMVSRFVV